MGLIRAILGIFVRLLDWLIPVGAKVKRLPEEQAKVDAATSRLAIYQFVACPFCVKVRRAARRMNLRIEYRNVLENEGYKQELLQGGGEWQVPCLRIPEGNGYRWMYESDAIIQYLKEIA